MGFVFSVRYFLAQGSAQGAVPSASLYATYSGESWKSLASGKVSITVMAVPSRTRQAASAAIARALPAVARWVASTASRPSTWRDTEHALYVEPVDDQPRIVEGPVRYKRRRG